MGPLINILTRTSNRPKFFSKCKESIENQIYKNVRHIISIDNDESTKYVEGLDYIRVHSQNLPPKKAILNKREIAKPYNLYFDDLLSEVEDGWVMFLDDDDSFYSETSLQTIVDNIEDNTALFWKVYIQSSEIVPRTAISKTKMPGYCDVSMIGFLVPPAYTGSLEFDGYSRCDWRVANQLCNLCPNVKYIDKILTRTQCGAHGGIHIDRPNIL